MHVRGCMRACVRACVCVMREALERWIFLCKNLMGDIMKELQMKNSLWLNLSITWVYHQNREGNGVNATAERVLED